MEEQINSYHVNADVVPAFQYRDYKAINSLDAARYIEEVSERWYLFHSARKWSEAETMQFLYDMYNYLEFE